MPTDTQVAVSAITAAPAEYVVPNTVELRLKAVRAEFTDNGAAVDWLPCVELVSDSAHKIATAVDQGVKVTAGSDASVSWFPGARVTTTAAAGSALITAQAFAYGNAAQITALNTFKYIDLSTFITSDSSAFDTSTVVIGGTTFTGVRFLKQGTYFVWVSGVGAAGGTPVNAGDIVTFAYDGGGDPFGNFQGQAIVAAPAGMGSGYLDGLGFMEAHAVKSTDVPPPTTPLVYKAKNGTGARGRVGYNAAFMFAPDNYPFPGL